MILAGVLDHPGPNRIHIDVEHDIYQIRTCFDNWRLKAVHDYLTPTARLLIEGSGKDGIDDSKEIGEEACIFATTGKMGMVAH